MEGRISLEINVFFDPAVVLHSARPMMKNVFCGGVSVIKTPHTILPELKMGTNLIMRSKSLSLDHQSCNYQHLSTNEIANLRAILHNDWISPSTKANVNIPKNCVNVEISIENIYKRT
jgi:hypothetical protein